MSEHETFISLFLEENEKLNLSAARTQEAVLKHIEDSLALSEHVPLEEGMHVLDVGSGGGFPGLLLAQIFPKTSFTLLDSVQKKCEAVQRMVEKLGLSNVEVVCGRAETLGHDEKYREQFDVVTARAVAGLSTLLELCLPFVSRDGVFVAYKGEKYEEEVANARVALETLGAELSSVATYTLPKEEDPRVLLEFKRVSPLSEDYPRREGVPKKSPLR